MNPSKELADFAAWFDKNVAATVPPFIKENPALGKQILQAVRNFAEQAWMERAGIKNDSTRTY